jgi:hypothetical protein
MSITPPMAIQLILVRGSKLPTSSLVLAPVSVQTLAEAAKNFYRRPIGDLLLRGRAEALRDFEPLTAANLMISRRRVIRTRLPSWKQIARGIQSMVAESRP